MTKTKKEQKPQATHKPFIVDALQLLFSKQLLRVTARCKNEKKKTRALRHALSAHEVLNIPSFNDTLNRPAPGPGWHYFLLLLFKGVTPYSLP